MIKLLILLVVLLVPVSVHSQTIIAGVPVYCNDAYGIPVMTKPAPYLNDVGMARIEGNGLRVIYLNPVILGQLPPFIQLFWYAHECAHHALGHTYGFNQLYREVEADCWAVRLGRNQGWLTPGQLNAMHDYFVTNPGSPWGHLPGPQRLQNFKNCYAS